MVVWITGWRLGARRVQGIGILAIGDPVMVRVSHKRTGSDRILIVIRKSVAIHVAAEGIQPGIIFETITNQVTVRIPVIGIGSHLLLLRIG